MTLWPTTCSSWRALRLPVDLEILDAESLCHGVAPWSCKEWQQRLNIALDLTEGHCLNLGDPATGFQILACRAAEWMLTGLVD